jgi:hypothetical protein
MEGKVDIRIQVTIEHENAQHVETIAVFRRAELQPETLGLSLAEAQDPLAVCSIWGVFNIRATSRQLMNGR